MRLIPALLFSLLCGGAYAAQPADLQPLAPPSQFASGDTSATDEPQVTITRQVETVEEFRVGGKLYMIKITPKVGQPYYLVDDRGDGKFARQETLDTGFRPPRWTIHSF